MYQPNQSPCGAQVTARGSHGVSGRHGAGRWGRHEADNNAIARELRLAKVPCIRDAAGCRQNGAYPVVKGGNHWFGILHPWSVLQPAIFPTRHRIQQGERWQDDEVCPPLGPFYFFPVTMETTERGDSGRFPSSPKLLRGLPPKPDSLML